MSIKSVTDNKELLYFIAKCDNPKLLKSLLNNSNTKFIRILKNIIKNLLKNNSIHIKNSDQKALLKNKNILRDISTQNNSKDLLKNIVKIRPGKGGWLNILIPILTSLIPAVIGLIRKKKK